MKKQKILRYVILPQVLFGLVSSGVFIAISFLILLCIRSVGGNIIPKYIVFILLGLFVLAHLIYARNYSVRKLRVISPLNPEAQIVNSRYSAMVLFLLFLVTILLYRIVGNLYIIIFSISFFIGSVVSLLIPIIWLKSIIDDQVYFRLMRGEYKRSDVDNLLSNLSIYKNELQKMSEEELKLLKAHSTGVENNFKLNYRFTLIVSLFSAVFALVMKEQNAPLSDIILIIVVIFVLVMFVSYTHKSAIYVSITKEIIDLCLDEKEKDRERLEKFLSAISDKR